MRQLFIYIIFISTIFSSFSQDNQVYLGIIDRVDDLYVPYKVDFTIKKGVVRGYSISDIGGDNETKTEIYGSFDSQNNTISFKETKMIYTVSEISPNYFCYISFRGVLNDKLRIPKIEGEFKGFYFDSSACVDGSVILHRRYNFFKKTIKEVDIDQMDSLEVSEKSILNIEELEKNLDSHEEIIKEEEDVSKNIEKKELDKIVLSEKEGNKNKSNMKENSNITSFFKTPKDIKLKKTTKKVNHNNVAAKKKARVKRKAKIISYEVEGDVIRIYVWDAGKVDGDRIHIIYKGKMILSNYKISTEKRSFDLLLKNNVNTLEIIAHSEGYIPSNTTSLEFVNGKNRVIFKTNLKKGEKSIIQFVKIDKKLIIKKNE